MPSSRIVQAVYFNDDGEQIDEDDASSSCSDEEPGQLTPDTLSNSWGKCGSWMVSGALPPGGIWMRQTETPFFIRRVQPQPKQLRRRPAQALLRRWGVGVINSKGYKGGNHAFAIGQDNFCVARLRNEWEVFGVFDGHGHNGHWPSDRAARILPFLLQARSCSEMLSKGDVDGALRWAMNEVERDLEAQAITERVDLKTSGCTAVVLLRNSKLDHVFVATVGDSRAALLRGDGSVIAETSDHKPCREDEMKRIEASGGVVSSSRYSDLDCRVYHRGTNYPGIAVSRSLGDCGVKNIGVTAEPEIVRWSIMGLHDPYALLCSDGVWEFISTAEVGDIVMSGIRRGENPEDVLRELLEYARAQWKSKITGATYCDDITMVLIPLGSLIRAPRWECASVTEVDGSMTNALNRACFYNCGTIPCRIRSGDSDSESDVASSISRSFSARSPESSPDARHSERLLRRKRSESDGQTCSIQ